MSYFVENLLKVSMIKESTFKLNRAVFNPNESIKFVLSMFKQKAKLKQVTLSAKILTHLSEPHLDPFRKRGELLPQ